jgi:hypothetical protein
MCNLSLGLEWRYGHPRELLTVDRTTMHLFLEFRVFGIRRAERRSVTTGVTLAKVRSHGDVRVKGGLSSAWTYFLSLFRYPRSEPVSITWSFPYQIKLTFGRRTRRLHQYPACGGLGSGGRNHSSKRLFKPADLSVRPPGSAETDQVSVDG